MTAIYLFFCYLNHSYPTFHTKLCPPRRLALVSKKQYKIEF